MFIGALEENLITQKYLIASTHTYYDTLTWCVQKQKPIPQWENYFHICRDPMVYLLFTGIAIVILGHGYFMEQFERYPKWDWNKFVCNCIRGTLGFPNTYNPTFHTTRFGYIIILLTGISVTTVINTMFMIFITNPILEPQVQSIQEIVRQKFSLMGDQFALHQILQQNQVN